MGKKHNDEKRKAELEVKSEQPSAYSEPSAPAEPEPQPAKPAVLGVVHLESTRKDRIERMVPQLLAALGVPPFADELIDSAVVEATRITNRIDELVGDDAEAPEPDAEPTQT